MTIAELMNKLAQYPTDTPLYISGYESGIEDLKRVNQVWVKLNANKDDYGGAHLEIDLDDTWEIKTYGQPDHQGVLLR